MRARPLLRPALFLALALAFASPAAAQRVRTPERGSPERAAIMDGLREAVAHHIGVSLRFEVRDLRVLNGWAFADVKPLDPRGRPMYDYAGTPLEEEWREGLMDDGIYALLRMRNGRWIAVEVVIGPTDVSWESWDEEFGAPSELFPGYDP
ncbi:MAG TPA: hypothetical protein VF006_02790 [Longimicrobium sp.]